MSDKGHSLLAGAQISLGGVNITGRDFDSYKPEEITYIVMRYMAQNADGNLYTGSLKNVLKKLWPDDYDKIKPNIEKKIYRLIKIFGFRHYVNNYGEHCWKISIDSVERGYKDRITVINPVVNPVTYRCGLCNEGPWGTRAEFLAHHNAAHKEKELVTITDGEEKKYVCEICGAEFTDKHSYGGHLNHHYLDEGVPRLPKVTSPEVPDGKPCPICGKKLHPSGLAGHTAAHKLTPLMKKVYDAVRQYEGLTPKEYADLLGMKSKQVIDVASRLRERQKIKSVGRRSKTRYYVDKRRGSKPKPVSLVPPLEVAEPAPAITEPIPAPEPQAIANIPETVVQILGAENVFQTNDGKTWLFKDGDLYLVSLERVAGR